MQQTALLGFLSTFRGREAAGGGDGWKPADEQVFDPSQLAADPGDGGVAGVGPVAGAGPAAGVGAAGAGAAGAGGAAGVGAAVPHLGVAHFDPPQIPDLKSHRAGFGPPRPLGSGPGVPIIDADLSDDPEAWRELETHPQLPAPAPDLPPEPSVRPTGFPPRPGWSTVDGTAPPAAFGVGGPAAPPVPEAPLSQPPRPSILPEANGFPPAGLAARMRMPAADLPFGSPSAGPAGLASVPPAAPVPPGPAPVPPAGTVSTAVTDPAAAPALAFAPAPPVRPNPPAAAPASAAVGTAAVQAPASPVHPTGLPTWPPPGMAIRPAGGAPGAIANSAAAPPAPASRPRLIRRSRSTTPDPVPPTPGFDAGTPHGLAEPPVAAAATAYLSWPPPAPGSIPWRLPVPTEYLPKLSFRERMADLVWEIVDRFNWGRVGLSLVVAGALVGAGLVAAGRLAGPGYPSSWDPRVAQIASFVQTDRGLTWKHPVKVEFLAPPDFVKKISGKPAPDNTLADEQLVGMYRAAGLISGNVSLASASSALLDNEVVGMYVPADKIVYVRGDAVTPDVRVTLAHELTHALQDQYFGINRMEGGRSDAEQATTALIEGDAVRVQDDYARTLSARDQALLVREQAAASAQARRANVSDHIPAFLVDQSTFPYDFGPAFVDALVQRGGNAAVNSAFRRPPSVDGQIIEPASYQAGAAVPKPVLPPLPHGARILQHPTGFGELPLLEAIAKETGFQTAWSAVQGWTADQMEGYQLGGRSCISVAAQMATAADAGRLYTAALAWAAAIPGATVSASGETVQLQSCDPGARWKPRQAGPDPYDALAARAFWVGELVSSAKLSPATSGCIVDSLMSRLGPQVMSAAAQAQSPNDANVRAVVAQLQPAAAGCRA